MSGLTKSFMYGLFALMIFCAVLSPAVADDDHHDKHREKNHEHHGGLIKPVNNAVYQETCGACHFVYQPELLPSASWIKILAALHDHFGEIVELGDNSKMEISGYLQSNSAETSSAKRAVKIMRSLGNKAPTRITEIPYIQEKHMGIPPDFFNSKAVGSRSNCFACHTTAKNGVYDDDNVKIPR